MPKILGIHTNIKDTKTVYVKAAGNTGQSITATVTDIPFTEIEDPSNVWDGSKITMPFDGIVITTLSIYPSTGGGSWALLSYIDGVVHERLVIYEPTAGVKNGTLEIKLLKNQVLSFRTQNINGTLLNDGVYHYMNAMITPI